MKTIAIVTKQQLEVSLPTRLTYLEKRIPSSWKKVLGLLGDNKKKLDLEKHIKKIRSEWK